jgi:chromate transporter
MAASSDSSPASELPFDIVTPTVRELCIGFFWVTISGFGGVLAFARRQFVLERRWMSPEQFNDLFALCQFLPGPNIVSFAMIYGWRLHRTAGAAAALAGLLVPPVILMILAGTFYEHYGTLPVFRGGLTGLAAAAAGLLIATAVQMAEPLARRDRLTQAGLAAVAFIAIGILQWSLPLVLLALAPVSVALAWRATPVRPTVSEPTP